MPSRFSDKPGFRLTKGMQNTDQTSGLALSFIYPSLGSCAVDDVRALLCLCWLMPESKMYKYGQIK